MSRQCTPEFICNPLDAMRRGTVDLGAPLYHDIIQIGKATEVEEVRLFVNKESARRITVARDDGAPIQAEVVVFDPDVGVTRTHAFSNPVDELEFRRGLGQRLWIACGRNVEMADFGSMQLFATTIGQYALIRQTEERIERQLGQAHAQ